MTEPLAAADSCEHYYETRILGGHPITVRACTLCRTPDWNDLREQAAELYRWGWQEGRDGKPARETLSAYDKPREATEATGACIHPDGYDGECPCPPNCSCCKVAPAEGPPCADIEGCDGQCCKRAEQAAPVDWQAVVRQRERELKAAGEARHAAEQQLAARDAALAACTAQLVHDQATLARVRRLADEQGEMNAYIERARLRAVLTLAENAPDGGPTVAEAAADDAAHWSAKYDRP